MPIACMGAPGGADTLGDVIVDVAFSEWGHVIGCIKDGDGNSHEELGDDRGHEHGTPRFSVRGSVDGVPEATVLGGVGVGVALTQRGGVAAVEISDSSMSLHLDDVDRAHPLLAGVEGTSPDIIARPLWNELTTH